MILACFIYASLLLLAYVAYIFSMLQAWGKMPRFMPDAGYIPSARVTVIVPMRNEEQHMDALLKSLLAQDYPRHLLEIILVDDASTDGTVKCAEKFISEQVRLIASVNPGNHLHKKRAIETGVQQAGGELIVTTDADCVHSTRWIKTIAAYYEKYKPMLITGPVRFQLVNGSFVENFQQLEWAPVMIQTAASIHQRRARMANGANLAYPKHVFEELGGYTGDRYASGDDVSLLHKITIRYGAHAIHFLKSPVAMVTTSPENTWKGLIRQRRRWLSKSRRTPGIIPFLILLANLAGWILLPLAVCYPGYAGSIAVYWLVKGFADVFLFATYARFSGDRVSPGYMLLSELIYTGYIVSLLPALFSKKITWKGRRI